MTEVRVPTLGESVTEATVATWFKKPGDSVAVDEMLCELETDKVTVEVPSPVAGTLSDIVAGEGETVGVDALLANISEGASAAPDEDKDADRGARASEPAGTARAAGDAAPTSKPSTSDGGGETKVMVPTLGESVSEATVATWFKKEGDSVAQDETLCELETDKVSVEVPAPAAGTLSKIIAPEGTTVQADAQLAVIAGGEGGGAQPSKPEADEPPAEGKGSQYAQPEAGNGGPGRSDVEDAPSAKKAMAEKGLNRDDVQGSGRDGRVMKEDVGRALAAASAPRAEAEASKAPRAPVAAEDAGREERVKMTRLRQTIARRLKDAQNTAAMLTTYNEVDMTEVMALRNEYKDLFEKKHGVRLGFMSFFTKACCHALKEVPEVNAEIDGTDIVYKNFVHMGIATGTPTGLVVPVIRDADSLSFAGIEKAIAEKGKRARDGKLSMAEMQGGTFTISNGGVYGSLMSSPILNPPQSGILGMHKIQQRPMVVDGRIEARPMMYLALSYDHRIVDGKGAVTFLVRVKEALEDPRRLLMDL
ncbi:2-oxoglutarate dehydrogenase complex dihydrolipoyllysine-residue succinyltransferase [Roseivivax isoporae]|uniref:Dihydrolipoyllysine-residue succinyltransferase component of 2-oxoglutarate dehydrogenase complex n=1 Tax=Roseivivax isoporae LMG 25204 TaxID=1449351 RepID=X7FB70_9RHOB|nr:2-oxoglutarate dehydrogenase complex dihydrolipoyllysine-residue succinyltransferase [Roseivivax isoporae]ETX29963.1 dihydrolipoamide succinyltransferase [Roseivivax isoporae LMG 25204]